MVQYLLIDYLLLLGGVVEGVPLAQGF
ncbi:hypothetical protein Golob_006846, partial [Gossypium lobatum]|nr:hypothetical protein [Gossypium lobatum]